MADKMYEYMDWPRIEGIVYGEEALPREILGPRIVKGGILIQCFFPQAKNVKLQVKDSGRIYKMKQEDEAGYFALLIPGKVIPRYVYLVEHKDKSMQQAEDPYSFDSLLTGKDEKLFLEGIHYRLYEKLGAHPMRRNGVKGVYFALWAPNALRVSVVGDFNEWNGCMHPMHRSGATGIFELFLPCAKPADHYKYEVMVKGGAVYQHTDPYGREREQSPNNASVVRDARSYGWQDEKWMAERGGAPGTELPLSIYEVNLAEWAEREEGATSYDLLGESLCAYVQKMGFTHVELMPVMEYDDNASGGYATTGYFSPTSRYGTPEAFKGFVNRLHEAGIGVILDWTPAHFPTVEGGMHKLDGTCLYEYPDARKRIHPFWGTNIFRFDSPMVKNFLITNALFWTEEFHIDGLRMDDVDAMLYLDYGRAEGDWTPNMYGSNENLDAIEFLKHLNSIMKKLHGEVLLIAQEDGLWPGLTGPVDETHMGFDYKWNNGWTGNVLDYMRMEPEERSLCHDELTSSMLYAYSEDYILTLHTRDIKSINSFLRSLPGDEKQQLAAAKAAYGYLMMHPGKKLTAIEPLVPKELSCYLETLLAVYRQSPALYELDCSPGGFEWVQCMEGKKNILVFLRKAKKKEDTLLVVFNFSHDAYDNYVIGVPYEGKYKEILNSDHKQFGGGGFVNPRVKSSRKKECDERENSIKIKAAPLSAALFSYRQ